MRALTLALFLATLGVLGGVAEPARAGDVEVQLSTGDGFVVKNDTGSIERMRIDEATGNISRNGALFVHTTGTQNSFVGEGAGNLAISGSYNAAFGQATLGALTTGSLNTAVGAHALRFNTSGSFNSALGGRALYLNTTGEHRKNKLGSGSMSEYGALLCQAPSGASGGELRPAR